MGTDAPPIAIKAVKEEETDLDSLPEDTTVASASSSLSLSLFAIT